MFTSRAEWRLMLRADNADVRLTPLGAAAGIVGAARVERLREKQLAMQAGRVALCSFSLPNSEWAAAGFGVKPNGELRSAEQMMHVPEAQLDQVEAVMRTSPHGWRKPSPPEGAPLPRLGREALEIEIKYSNYLERQEREVARLQEHSMAAIPRGTDFRIIPCLSKEEVEKLTAVQPATLAEAGAIAGVTPKALFYVYQHLKRGTPRSDPAARSRASPELSRQAVAAAVSFAAEDTGVPEALMHHFPMTDDA